MVRGPENLRSPEIGEKSNSIHIRPFEDADCDKAVKISQSNFRTTYSPLFPRDVVDAYIAANRGVDLKAALKIDGTEAYVAETDGKIAGFCLIRYNIYARRDPQGELELRRLHVDSGNRGQRIGTKLFELVEQRGKEIGVELLVSLASGSSRPFFEQNDWIGRTELNPMPKRKTSALVFAAQKRIAPEPLPLYEAPTHLVYAGESIAKEEYIHNLAKEIDPDISVYGAKAEEDPVPDVFESAKSKALSVRLDFGRNVTPLIIASDIRNELLQVNPASPHRYKLVDRGKPESDDPLDEIRSNFALLLDTAKETKKPAPYIIRSAAYLHNPLEPDKDSFSEADTSIWMSREGLEELSTNQGISDYREEVIAKYGVDITQMSSGFALPVFLKRGYVVGLNGHPLESLPHKDQIIKKSIHTALVGMDQALIRRRLGDLY